MLTAKGLHQERMGLPPSPPHTLPRAGSFLRWTGLVLCPTRKSPSPPLMDPQCALNDISSFTYLGQPGGRKRELQMTGWDGNFATEQTRHKVSVTSLIIQTEHKDNSFKYILVRVFDRNRYAISHEGSRRQHHAHAWHKLLVLSTLKMEKRALVRQQCCTCPMPCTSFLYAADVKKRILTIKLRRVLKGGEGGGGNRRGCHNLARPGGGAARDLRARPTPDLPL